MLPRDEADLLFRRSLAEFAPDWESVDGLTEITVRDRDGWLSGVGTFGVTLHHRKTGAFKVLGRRGGTAPGVTYHRGISFLVLKAYADRNTDPVRRYLQEIGLAPHAQPLPTAKTG
ncbi:MAG: hypothetical protein ACREM3_18015 [Candidatus Rokuibacteriota bacterium]